DEDDPRQPVGRSGRNLLRYINHESPGNAAFDGFDLYACCVIVFIDLVMSGDNAIIIGLAAAGLPPDLRRRAILLGIMAATVLRIGFSAITYQLLSIIGLTLAGGILLLWVAYKMWREVHGGAFGLPDPDEADPLTHPKTVRGAMTSIIVADVTMSLDNVLAVAGAAHDAPGMMVFGLLLSIALMAFAANLVAKLLEKNRWLAYLGLLVVLYVALEMIWRGSHQVYNAVGAIGF
ncbi:MAG: TerC family protein, partial [Rhodobacterales bacterium]|nr:TerC family protein [Rhodobacterales bacterium]